MAKQPLVDIRQTKQYSQFMQSLGWNNYKIISGKKYAHCFIKRLPIIPFPIIKILRYHEFLDKKQHQQLSTKFHPIIFKEEPLLVEKQDNSQVYFKVEKNNHSPLIPTKTIWLDLTLSEQKLLQNSKAKTRYNLKRTQTVNLETSIIPGDKMTQQQLREFYKLWSKNKPYNWLFKPKFIDLQNLVKYFHSKCFFVFCYPRHSELVSEAISNNLLAACLILASPNMAFYWHNASTLEGKKIFAPTLCVWEAIMESKKRGLKMFDFEGVWDERYPDLNQGWKGFTRFKMGFVTS